MPNILEIKNLTKNFSSGIFKPQKFLAVDNVSFELNQGQVLAFLGSNGSGKSTLMQMLLSTITPTSGSIKYFGKSLTTHRSEILKHVGFGSSYTKLPPNLLVKENMAIIGRLYGLTEKQAIQNSYELMEKLNSAHLFNKKNGVLSAGQSAIVQIVKALMIKPKIVVLDEPIAALDVEIAQQVRDLINQYNKDYGLTVIISSHNMAEIDHIIDRALIMKEGRLIANSTPSELIQKVKDAQIEIQTEQTNEFEKILQEKKINWHVIEGLHIFKINQNDVANFLEKLHENKIQVKQISIIKPTVDDYLKIVNKN
jgi:ABC-2 type transport system ATP-binding protein